MARLDGHEQAVLGSVPLVAEVGLLGANGITQGQDLINMTHSLRVAAMQGGVALDNAEITELARYKIVFAIGRQAVSADEAAALDSYVRQGGTLVFNCGFAGQDEFGGDHGFSPGQGLGQRWGFTVTNMADAGRAPYACNLDGVDESLRGTKIGCIRPWREGVSAAGWESLAAYDDGTPALLKRGLEKGNLYYLNAVYNSHRYIQWRTPTDATRQGFYGLVRYLCRQAGARPSFALSGAAEQFLHLATKQYSDASGDIRYIILKNSIQAPWVNGRFEWLGEGDAVYNVLDGRELAKSFPLAFRPNEGVWLAVTKGRVARLRVVPLNARIRTGEKLGLRISVLGRHGEEIPGEFPLTLRVRRGDEELKALRRSVSLASGAVYELQTAPGDRPGRWRVEVTDGVSGTVGECLISAASGVAVAAPRFCSEGWLSELTEPQLLAHGEFTGRLSRLSELYRTPQDGSGWTAKQMLCANYDFFPGTRHALLRPLADVDWRAHVPEVVAALRAGATFILTGEDLGLDPGSGMATYPHFGARQIEAVAMIGKRGRWRLGTADGDTVVVELGAGRLILCRESVDAAGHSNSEAASWQERWLAELAATGAGGQRLSAMDSAALRQWWIGKRAATGGGREVSWLGGNRREVSLTFDPQKQFDSVFTMALPPTGEVSALRLALSGSPGRYELDIGADGTVEATVDLREGESVDLGQLADWRQAIKDYAAVRVVNGDYVRDGSGWRQIPVRLRGGGAATLILANPALSIK